ncbi:glutamate-rich protein 3-like isoform X4 [Bolinopsis microptera]|uniref:glutamate-rich protein 3-like isoform X4 n=1 Tax=Bolinopsis microptera TaxID=2820187 RepID=UPI00307937CF
MALKPVGPLDSYNSLTDEYLVDYFNNKRIRKHLRHMGLITRRGEVVDEPTFRYHTARKEHRAHVKELMSQAVINKTLELERNRRAFIRDKLIEIRKIETVNRVKRDRDGLPDYSSEKGIRPKSAPSKVKGEKQTPKKCKPKCAPRSADPKKPRCVLVNNFTDEGLSDKYGSDVTLSTAGYHAPPNSNIYQSYSTPDMNQPMVPGRSLPVRPKSAMTRNKRNHNQIKTRPKSASSNANSSPYTNTSTVPSTFLQRRQIHSMSKITLRYLGKSLDLSSGVFGDAVQVMIMQQHCGGNTVCVFQNLVSPNECFTFTSRRHRDAPFGITIYLGSMMDTRLSTCCEYKHKPGHILGGKSGHFALVRVEGCLPCYKCFAHVDEFKRQQTAAHSKFQEDVHKSDIPEKSSKGKKKRTSRKKQGSHSSYSSSDNEEKPSIEATITVKQRKDPEPAGEPSSTKIPDDPVTMEPDENDIKDFEKLVVKTNNIEEEHAIVLQSSDTEDEPEPLKLPPKIEEDLKLESSSSSEDEKEDEKANEEGTRIDIEIIKEVTENGYDAEEFHSDNDEEDKKSDISVASTLSVDSITSEASVKSDASIKSEASVKSDVSTKSEASIKSETSIKSASSSKSNSSIKSNSSTKSASSIKSNTSNKSYSSIKSDATIKSEGSMKSETSVKSHSSSASSASTKSYKSDSSKKSDRSISSKGSSSSVKSDRDDSSFSSMKSEDSIKELEEDKPKIGEPSHLTKSSVQDPAPTEESPSLISTFEPTFEVPPPTVTFTESTPEPKSPAPEILSPAPEIPPLAFETPQSVPGPVTPVNEESVPETTKEQPSPASEPVTPVIEEPSEVTEESRPSPPVTLEITPEPEPKPDSTGVKSVEEVPLSTVESKVVETVDESKVEENNTKEVSSLLVDKVVTKEQDPKPEEVAQPKEEEVQETLHMKGRLDIGEETLQKEGRLDIGEETLQKEGRLDIGKEAIEESADTDRRQDAGFGARENEGSDNESEVSIHSNKSNTSDTTTNASASTTQLTKVLSPTHSILSTDSSKSKDPNRRIRFSDTIGSWISQLGFKKKTTETSKKSVSPANSRSSLSFRRISSLDSNSSRHSITGRDSSTSVSSAKSSSKSKSITKGEFLDTVSEADLLSNFESQDCIASIQKGKSDRRSSKSSGIPSSSRSRRRSSRSEKSEPFHSNSISLPQNVSKESLDTSTELSMTPQLDEKQPSAISETFGASSGGTISTLLSSDLLPDKVKSNSSFNSFSSKSSNSTLIPQDISKQDQHPSQSLLPGCKSIERPISASDDVGQRSSISEDTFPVRTSRRMMSINSYRSNSRDSTFIPQNFSKEIPGASEQSLRSLKQMNSNNPWSMKYLEQAQELHLLPC